MRTIRNSFFLPKLFSWQYGWHDSPYFKLTQVRKTKKYPVALEGCFQEVAGRFFLVLLPRGLEFLALPVLAKIMLRVQGMRWECVGGVRQLVLRAR